VVNELGGGDESDYIWCVIEGSFFYREKVVRFGESGVEFRLLGGVV